MWAISEERSEGFTKRNELIAIEVTHDITELQTESPSKEGTT